ncbi:hypothetical protein HDU78_000651 [Chytriomyces hyalinus]|nr:hypothetical protein HDU78_000651 [Chytriomyces hyalinus]
MLSLGVGAQHHNLHMQQQNYQHLDHDAKVARAETEADKAHKEAARLGKLCEDATDDRTVDKYMMLLQTPSYPETPSVSVNQSFVSETAEPLSAHMDDAGTPGGSRPFVCPLFSKCGKAYKDAKSLSAHIKTAKVHKIKEDRIVLARLNFGNPLIESEMLAELSSFSSSTPANVKTSKQRSTMNSAFSAAADVLLDAAAQHESQSHSAETSTQGMNSNQNEQSLSAAVSVRTGESLCNVADESTKHVTGHLPVDDVSSVESMNVDIEADEFPEPSAMASGSSAEITANTENSASLAASCIAAIGAVVAPKSTPATATKANKRKTRGGSTEPHATETSSMEESAALQSSVPAVARKEVEGAVIGEASVKKRKTRSNSIAEVVDKPDLHAVAQACEYIEVVSKSPRSKPRQNTPMKQTQIKDTGNDSMEVDVVGNLSDDEEVGVVAKPADTHDRVQSLPILPAEPEAETNVSPSITPQTTKPQLEESVPAQTSVEESAFADLATEPLSTEPVEVDASVPERNEESLILAGDAVDATLDPGVGGTTDTAMNASVDAGVGTSVGASVGATADANVDATADATADANVDANVDATKAVNVEASVEGAVETAVGTSIDATSAVNTATEASATPITVLKSPTPKQNTAALTSATPKQKNAALTGATPKQSTAAPTSATPSVKPSKPAAVEFSGPFECEPGFKPVLGDPRSGWHYNLKFGAIVDVYSRSYRAWYPARVMFYIVTAQNTYKVKIHYIGYAKQYDEVFDLIDPIKREYIRPYVPTAPGPETRSMKPTTDVVTAEAATLWDLGDAAGTGDWHGTVYEGVKDATRDGAFLLMKEPLKKRK